MNNIRKLVKQVAEGMDPQSALNGKAFEHEVPNVLESFDAKDLEGLYGDDFTVDNKARTFQPIDTGAGVRIKNIEVRSHPHFDRGDATLPHKRNSRVYVQPTEHARILKTAFDSTLGQGKLPQPSQGINIGAALTGQPTADDNKSVNAIDAMMALRKPENNPHQAWRSGVLPHVFKHLGMTGEGEGGQPHAQWHKNAGCGSCPCSPGFILHKSKHPLAQDHDIWVEVD